MTTTDRATALETPAAAGQTIEHLECRLDVAYNWGYEQTRKELRDLYTKAKHCQWIPESTLTHTPPAPSARCRPMMMFAFGMSWTFENAPHTLPRTAASRASS